MAPKNPTRQSTRKTNTTKQPPSSKNKRKRPNPILPTSVERFISEEARVRFEKNRSFEVVGERRFEVIELTKYPIFETMIRAREWQELNK